MHILDGNDQTDRHPANAPAGSPVTGKPAGLSFHTHLKTYCRNLLVNIRSGCALALLRSPQKVAFRISVGDLVAVALAELISGLACAVAILGRDGTFTPLALPNLLFHLSLMLLCGTALARLYEEPRLTTVIPVALISIGIPLELLHGLLEWLVQLGLFRWLSDFLYADHFYRFYWWWTTASGVFIMRLCRSTVRRSVAALALFAILLGMPFWLVPRSDLWAADPGGAVHRLSEKVLYAQHRLLDSALAGLLPGKRRVTDLYYVGFGGDGSQDVFLKELDVIEKLFNERFAAAGRSITLVNNRKSSLTRPFATATALSRTLTRVGAVMNRDEDILFLYLTSHGTPEPLLRVDNSSLELDQIDPKTLRTMLDEAGIRWRVIVVSSCFSGGFLEELKDDRTLIMTASAADRESFGCSNESDFTWFGKAYFQIALRETFSFTDAFDRAQRTVRQWEKEGGEAPSEPQMHLGKEMGRRLAALEKRLTGLASTAGKGMAPGECPVGTARRRSR
jgi:hypothetical protein